MGSHDEELLDLVAHFETALDMEKNVPMKGYTNFYIDQLSDIQKAILAKYNELKKEIPGEMLKLMEADGMGAE